MVPNGGQTACECDDGFIQDENGLCFVKFVSIDGGDLAEHTVYDLEVHSFSEIEFAVQTNTEAFVTLTSTLGHQISLMIGESDNTVSKITFLDNSTNPTTSTLAHLTTTSPLIVDDYVYFKIDWHCENLIVKRGTNRNDYETYMIVNDWRQTVFSEYGTSFAKDFWWESFKVHHGSQAIGSYWKIFENSIHTVSADTEVPELSDYQTVADLSSAYQIKFAVKAHHNAHLLLRTDAEDKYFRIIIGGWDNSRSAIKSTSLSTKLVEVYSSPLNYNEYATFQLDWHSSDMVLRQATYTNGVVSYFPLMTLQNWRSHNELESTGKITSLGITTAMGSKNVLWKINDPKCTHLAPVPECKVVLVRQSIDDFHPAQDNLAGTAKYGMAGSDTTFSRRFDTWNFDTFIFATKDHQYFQAMTKK